ncbi:hypothetical protein [Methylobacterium gnaphalii]|uniref:Uncharacterized protein n=1 Tax=Methylobacterium gnaphalii TaxID=1010610 RepID=A0A512JNA1_9HYPH|nr:hypothetical protein [Methylobacterium gnaphalii]GEP11439.1 hypothetical protein MGN01_32840 [Methylobacterium gnaphalii]GJD70213.1 hypothetical protein MMMDOFMJ_3155 [Methylobacterium gnaphalii]GLS50550.1 hypothetical protein GCM10007885_34020 [Methylobacterium gnaphalii]
MPQEALATELCTVILSDILASGAQTQAEVREAAQGSLSTLLNEFHAVGVIPALGDTNQMSVFINGPKLCIELPVSLCAPRTRCTI